MAARWSKWWWLEISSVPVWSSDERLAAVVLAVTGLFILLLAWALFAVFITALKFDLSTALIVSFVIVVLGVGRTTARIAEDIFPTTVAKGDEAAARRVGDTPYFPDESPGLWWASYRTMGSQSQEENFVIRVIYCIASLILLPTFIILPPVLRTLCEVDKRTSILATMIAMVPLALFIGRRFCIWMWPDVSRTADTNAWARYNRRNRNRNLHVKEQVCLASKDGAATTPPWPRRPKTPN